MPDRNGKIFYTSITSLSHISKRTGDEPYGTVYELFPAVQSKSGGAAGSFPLETGNRRRRSPSGGKNGGRSSIYFWEIIGRWKSESVSWELSAISC